MTNTTISTTILALGCMALVDGVAMAQVPAPVGQSGADISIQARPDAPAAAPPPTALEEFDRDIIVSARKRDERSQDVPLAITAVDQKALQRVQAVDLRALTQLAPNLQIVAEQSSNDVASVYLRGFGVGTNDPSTEPAIATFVDGIYQTVLTGTLADLWDVESVEVLRGPQSTLLGKNAAAGAISLRTKRPSGETDGQAQLTYGRYDRIEGRGLLDFKLSDTLSANLLGSYRRGGGYVKNLFRAPGVDQTLGDQNVLSVRAGMLFKPTNDINWFVTGNYRINKSEQPGARNVSVPFPRDTFNPTPLQCIVFGAAACVPNPHRRTTAAQFTDVYNVKSYSLTSDLGIGLGPVRISSLSGFMDYRNVDNQDVDNTPLIVLEARNVRLKNVQYSQELRIASEKGGGFDLDGRLDWVLGGFYSRNKYTLDQHLGIFGSVITQFQGGLVRSSAIYGHSILNITDAWNVSGGIRQTWDKKDHSYLPAGFPANQLTLENVNFKKFTYEIGSQYKISPGQLVYLRYSVGYRGGGFTGIPSVPNAGSVFSPENVKAYEIGAKTDWLGRRLRVNLYGFYNKYDNLQRSGSIFSPTSGVQLVTLNAASAVTKGVEFESSALLTDNLSVQANIGYLKTSYDSYLADILSTGTPQDLSGFRFPFSPKLTANLNATYRRELSIGNVILSAAYDYRSTYLNNNTVDTLIGTQRGYGLTNGSITYETVDGRYSIKAYVTNLFAVKYNMETQVTGNISTIIADGQPTLWGLILTAKF